MTQDFPTLWKTAIIIPVPKPGKCFQILVVTGLLPLLAVYVKQWTGWSTWYLERHKVITEHHSGFRRRRSTVDNLVTLETSIIDAFVGRKHLVSIFFYLEKAYDTTWKHGILLDLYKTGLRGRLPMFICDFFIRSLF